MPASSSRPSTAGLAEAVSTGPSVHRHCRCRFLRPATGVLGQVSLSSSSDDSRFSPVCGELTSFSLALSGFSSVRVSSFRSVVPVTYTGEGSSRVEIVDDEDSMSECAIMYLVVLMSSVKGARNATFFGVGNIGRGRANDVFLLLVFGRGPLLSIEGMLYASWYGASPRSESNVDTEDEEVSSGVLVEADRSALTGVDSLDVLAGTFVVNGVKEGR